MSCSFRKICWSQTKACYTSPRINLPKRDPKSRNNLWYYYDKSRTETFYRSLRVQGQSMNDAFFLNNSTFPFIGTSGSGLHVDDISSNAWFMINKSLFDGNFAYDSFPKTGKTMRIVEFSKMLESPFFEVLNSKFKNPSGCSSTYGNNLFFALGTKLYQFTHLYQETQISTGKSLVLLL